MLLFEKIKKSARLIYKAGDNTVDHDGIENAGFLSFMWVLSLFPFLVFFFAILGTLGETSKGKELIDWLVANADPNIVQAITPSLNELLNGPPQGLLTISIIGTIWTSSSMVEGIRTTLNRAYRVHTPPNYWLRRLFSIGQIFVLSIVLIAAMFALVFAPIIFEKVYGIIQSINFVNEASGNEQIEFDYHELNFLGVEWQYIRYFGIGFIMTFFISSLYYFLPNVRHSWRKTLPGAAIAALGWFGVAKLFSYYLSNFDRLNLIYGSLGGIIAFLVFFYLINIIFIFGAELNYLLQKEKGEKIEEKEQVAPEDVREDEKYLDEEKKKENKIKTKKKAKSVRKKNK